MHKGFIKLHRRVRDHWLYQEERTFSRFEAWTDLIMRANYDDRKILLGNELKDVKKGQVITSIKKLCDDWKWSNTKVRNFLKILQEDGMISYKSTSKNTVINICNYYIYHSNKDDENTSKTHQKHIKNTSKTHNEEVTRSNKKYKNKYYRSKIIDLLSVFSSIDNFPELNKQYWDVIRETRVSKKVSESVIYRIMDSWKKYDPAVIEYALKEHIENHKGKREEYTLGIMRKTTTDDVKGKSNSNKRRVARF